MRNLARAPRPSADRATDAPHGAAKSVSAIRSVSTGAVPDLPWAERCRRRDAIEAVKDRYWSMKNRLAERMEREIARIEREGI